MTYDQIWVLSCDEKKLERRRLAVASVEKLIEEGVIKVE